MQSKDNFQVPGSAPAIREMARHWRTVIVGLGSPSVARRETYLDHAFSVRFNGEAALHPRLKPEPPLLLTNGATTAECAPVLREWINRHKIQLVISNWMNIPDALELIRPEFPTGIAVVELELESKPHRLSCGGTKPRDIVVGELAMEQLAMLLRLNQAGWVDTTQPDSHPGDLDRRQSIGDAHQRPLKIGGAGC